MSKRDRHGKRYQRRYDDVFRHEPGAAHEFETRHAAMTPYEDYKSHTFWGRIHYRIVWRVAWWLGGAKNMDPAKPWKRP